MLEDNIFVCMELGKQPYSTVIEMPIQRMNKYLKWKSDLEEEKKSMMEEEIKKK